MYNFGRTPSTLGRAKQFLPENYVQKNYQNARILRDICQKNYQNAPFLIFTREINKKMFKLYMIIAWKIFPPIFWGGGGHVAHLLRLCGSLVRHVTNPISNPNWAKLLHLSGRLVGPVTFQTSDLSPAAKAISEKSIPQHQDNTFGFYLTAVVFWNYSMLGRSPYPQK